MIEGITLALSQKNAAAVIALLGSQRQGAQLHQKGQARQGGFA